MHLAAASAWGGRAIIASGFGHHQQSPPLSFIIAKPKIANILTSSGPHMNLSMSI